MDRNYLFNTFDLRNVIEGHEQKMIQEIETLNKEELLKSSDEIIARFENDYKIIVPLLLEDKITHRVEDADIDVSQDFSRGILDRSNPFYVSGTEITFFLPFEGDGELLKCQSSRWSTNPPRATVENNKIIIKYKSTTMDTQEVRKQLDTTISQIKELLMGTANDAIIFNDSLRGKIENRLNTRKDKLEKDQKLSSDLGFPEEK
ncbi:MAG TPA: hypothetical protein VLF89_10225 [Candidatus Saccharimonadales bacterium]|nr:hypothetical protein [Candidatus Saccharimonadales bacterium]